MTAYCALYKHWAFFVIIGKGLVPTSEGDGVGGDGDKEAIASEAL